MKKCSFLTFLTQWLLYPTPASFIMHLIFSIIWYECSVLRYWFLFSKYLLIISYVAGIVLHLRQIFCISNHLPTPVLPPIYFSIFLYNQLNSDQYHLCSGFCNMSLSQFCPSCSLGLLMPSKITSLLCFRIRT